MEKFFYFQFSGKTLQDFAQNSSNFTESKEFPGDSFKLKCYKCLEVAENFIEMLFTPKIGGKFSKMIKTSLRLQTHTILTASEPAAAFNYQLKITHLVELGAVEAKKRARTLQNWHSRRTSINSIYHFY